MRFLCGENAIMLSEKKKEWLCMLCPNCEKEVSYGRKMEDFVCPLCGFAAGPKPAVHAPSSGKSSFSESAAASRLFMWAFRVRIIGVVLCILLAVVAILSAVLASKPSGRAKPPHAFPIRCFPCRFDVYRRLYTRRHLGWLGRDRPKLR